MLAYGFTPGVERAVGEQDPILFRNFHDLETIAGTHYETFTIQRLVFTSVHARS